MAVRSSDRFHRRLRNTSGEAADPLVPARCNVGGVLKSASLFVAIMSVAAPAAAQETLVVTAERRERPLEETAQSLSHIGSEELQRIDADHIAEILARMPGVGLHRGSGAEHLTAIRSPVLTAGAGAGSFLFLENGVPLRSPGFANINGLFDSHFEIARGVEVVRGPSGALYGANAIHGVVNVLTPAPAEALSLFAEAFGDTEDRYKWKGTVADTVGDNGFFAGASVTHEGGYRDDAGLDQQKLTLRHVHDGAVRVDTIFSFDNLEQETAGYIVGRDALADPVLRRANGVPGAYRDAKSLRWQSTIETAIGEGATLKFTPYARWNEMAFPQHFLPSNALEENGHWSFGVQSAVYRDAGALSLIAGVDAEYTEGRLREFQAAPTVFSYTEGLHYDYEVRAVNASGFAQARYAFAAGTSLTAAIRIDGAVYAYDNLTGAGVVGRFLRPDDRTDRFVTASPKFTVRHELSDSASAYVSYARGARPPQTTDLYRLQINQTGDRARPEFIDALELGLRARLGAAVSIDVAGYYMEKKNFFFRDADGFNVANGRTRHLGMEAEVAIDVSQALFLRSAVSYAAHTYRFDRLTGSATETIVKGGDVDTAPRVLANTRLSWIPDERIRLEAEWAFVGAYFTDAANDHAYEGYNLINLRGEAALTDRLTAFLTLKNAANAFYAERADFAFGEERFFPGEGRTLGVGLRYRR